MQHVQGEIKEILSACDGTPTQKLIAILTAAGITASAEVARLIGVTQRAIQKANSSSFERTPVRELQFVNANSSSSPSRADNINNKTTTSNKVLGTDKPKPRNRGTRLPADWRLPKTWGDWTQINFANVTVEQIRFEAEKFADYWHSLPGQKACKLDWQKTWQNWCRTSFTPNGKGGKLNFGRMAYDERRAYDMTGGTPFRPDPATPRNLKPRLTEAANA